jgi:hypothetical protein
VPAAGSWSSRFPLCLLRLDPREQPGATAYAVTLLLSMPAGLILDGARGTIWNGSVPLAAGHRASWSWSPLRSIADFGFGLDWRIEGAETDLTGTATLKAAGVRLRDVKGLVDARVLFAYVPDLPFSCAFLGKVDISGASLGGRNPWIEGRIGNGAGTCSVRDEGGRDMAVPPSLLEASRTAEGGAAISLLPRDGRGGSLLDGELTSDGNLSYRLTPEGARRLPFAVPPGGAGETVEIAF